MYDMILHCPQTNMLQLVLDVGHLTSIWSYNCPEKSDNWFLHLQLSQHPYSHTLKIWSLNDQHEFIMAAVTQGLKIAIYDFPNKINEES